MAAPNKLLMGLASILGAYHGNKRRKREALKTHGITLLSEQCSGLC